MRRIQIKIWPEVISQIPAIIPIDRNINNKTNPIDIDLTNVVEVNSSGLNILIINMINLSLKSGNNEWNCLVPKLPLIADRIKKLNFYNLLFKNFPNQNIFLRSELLDQLNNEPILLTGSINQKSFPIYEIDFVSSADRRVKVDEFKEYLINKLYYLQIEHSFDLNILIQILTEMAKNSADHTFGNAYFGLDLNETDEAIILRFSFGDMGVGINQMIRQSIKDDIRFTNKADHLALTDSYHYAFDVGTTTKPNSGINKGIGMSTIFNMAKQLNFKLSVFDAKSRGLLTNAVNHSHAELRKIFYNIGFNVGFYYFGELEIIKNENCSI